MRKRENGERRHWFAADAHCRGGRWLRKRNWDEHTRKVGRF